MGVGYTAGIVDSDATKRMIGDKQTSRVEEPLFFDNRGSRAFGVLHRPVGMDRCHGFIFCHPFGEEKLWSHRSYVAMARRLSDIGFSVLRFDFRGHGDSDGEFARTSITTRIQDIERAIDEMRSQVPQLRLISLFGLRLGATLAAQVALKLDGCASLILWEPISDGKKYVSEVLRAHLTMQLTAWGEIRKNRDQLEQVILAGGEVVVDGYAIGKSLLTELLELKPGSTDRQYSGPCLILQVNRNATQPIREDMKSFAKMFSSVEIYSAVELPFWRETRRFYPRAMNLMQQTISWLEQTHG
jgi:uncharacterized protein